ncbi:MAG: LysR family transcriptional regulator [Clostridia bacterium]|nr:LysR family transcriptional regulator [Clostridia bacterium]MBR2422251.1 LysR family transcriptional regulator [Oscillospiraceae bacterium]
MNILQMKYAVEVAKTGSLNKASQALLIAQPNLSRSIKELEGELGITIFDRSSKGMKLTLEGEEFIGYAQNILRQIEQMEKMYKDTSVPKQRFSISVPRASYISEAFARFSCQLSPESAEVFYKETNSQRTIRNLLENDYRLGIIRYAENYDQYFRAMLDEKELNYETICEFTYQLLMSRQHPLAEKTNIAFDDLRPYIEIAHADPYVPSLPLSKVVKEELPDNINRRIFIYERASQFDLLSENPATFMWISPVPDKLLSRYGLVQRKCDENQKVYRDVLIYRKGYRLTALDNAFITELCMARRKYL